MNDLLYYPGFEIEDQRWLKFALLYLERVSTIVPLGGDQYVSRQYEDIENKTNLLKRCRPELVESQKSSVEAIEVIEKYFRDPIKYFRILGRIDVVNYWRNSSNQNLELFFSKFSYDFERFCLDSGLAHRTDNGIRLPHQIGLIYMAILAHNIGERRNNSIISDIKEHNMISTVNQNTWRYNKRFNELKAVKKIIELNLPRNIDSISIDEVIELRNKQSYQKKLTAFRQAVTKLNDDNDGYLNESNFRNIISEIEEAKSDLTDEVTNFCSTLLQVGLGVYLTIGPNIENFELIKELAGIGFLATGSKKLIKTFTNEERYASQYLTQIRRFSSRR